MKNIKLTTSVIGIVVAIILAAWGIFQPALTGGAADYYTLIPAAVIAIVGILEKDITGWKTTTFLGILFPALIAGASAFQDKHTWIYVVGAILASIGGYLTSDKTGSTTTGAGGTTTNAGSSTASSK